MPRKKENMTPDEYQVMCEHLKMAREKARERKLAMGNETRVVKQKKSDVRSLALKKEMESLEAREKVLLETPTPVDIAPRNTALEDIAQRNTAPRNTAKHQSDSDNEDVRPIRRKRTDTTPPANPFEMYQFIDKMKTDLKTKYKSKYSQEANKVQEAKTVPEVQTQNVISGTLAAKDQLKVKVQEEVRRLAHSSLFGSAW